MHNANAGSQKIKIYFLAGPKFLDPSRHDGSAGVVRRLAQPSRRRRHHLQRHDCRSRRPPERRIHPHPGRQKVESQAQKQKFERQ